MKTLQPQPVVVNFQDSTFPDADSLAALRGWYAGLSSRAAVARYLPGRKASGASSRAMLGRIRRRLIAFAESRHRADLVNVFQHPPDERQKRAHAVGRAIETLRSLPIPQPQISDDVALWLTPRSVRALHEHGIRTLADLTVRIPRRNRWWTTIRGLGVTAARQIESFFAAHQKLTECARNLIGLAQPGSIVPWEQLRLPHEIDGSQGSFRAPRAPALKNETKLL